MDNKKNNLSRKNYNSDTELDSFFKEALQNHAVPTGDHVWRRVQHGLVDKKEGTTSIKTIAKRSYLPIWSAVSGIAASLLIWAVFFSPSNSEELNSKTLVATDKIEIGNNLNTKENSNSVSSISLRENSENNQENQNKEATSSNLVASTTQQIPPTINKINTVYKNQNVKALNSQNHVGKTVASTKTDPKKIKKQQVKGEANEKIFNEPSTHIADDVWASDFVVHNSDYPAKKEMQNAEIHQLSIDNQNVAITVKVGNNESYNTNQAIGIDANHNPSQFAKAKSVLKEVWNLKTGKKVNLQKILPNNEKSTESKTTHQSNSIPEIHAD